MLKIIRHLTISLSNLLIWILKSQDHKHFNHDKNDFVYIWKYP